MVYCFYFTSYWWMYFLLPILAIAGFCILIALKKHRNKPLPFFSHIPHSYQHRVTTATIRHGASGDSLISFATATPYPYFLPVFYSQGIHICGVLIPYTRAAALFVTFLLGIFLFRTFSCVQQHNELVTVLKDSVNKVSSVPAYPSQLYRGRGIVICGGGRKEIGMIYATVYTLREVLKTDLPIEIFHPGQGELTQKQKSLLESKFADVKVRDAFSFDVEEKWRSLFMPGTDNANDDKEKHNYNAFNLDDGRVGLKRILSRSKFALKAFALLFSNFKEVVMLDYNTIPVKDPSVLFQDTGYIEKGNIFWKDADLHRPKQEFFKALKQVALETTGDEAKWKDVKDFWFEETESGQWLVDKQRCWSAVYASWLLNSIPETTMDYVQEKDTFFFGFLLAHLAAKTSHSSTPPATFHHMPHPVAFAGFYDKPKTTMSFTAFTHFDSQEHPLFFHHVGALGERALERLVDDPVEKTEVEDMALMVAQADIEADVEESGEPVAAGGERVLWAHLLVWTRHSQSVAYEKKRSYPVDVKLDRVLDIPDDVQQIGTRYADAMQQFYAHKV